MTIIDFSSSSDISQGSVILESGTSSSQSWEQLDTFAASERLLKQNGGRHLLCGCDEQTPRQRAEREQDASLALSI